MAVVKNAIEFVAVPGCAKDSISSMLKSVLKIPCSRILELARVEGVPKSQLLRPPLENQPEEQSNSDSCNQSSSIGGAFQGCKLTSGMIYNPAGAFPRILYV